jgi:hypothetical protein
VDPAVSAVCALSAPLSVAGMRPRFAVTGRRSSRETHERLLAQDLDRGATQAPGLEEREAASHHQGRRAGSQAHGQPYRRGATRRVHSKRVRGTSPDKTRRDPLINEPQRICRATAFTSGGAGLSRRRQAHGVVAHVRVATSPGWLQGTSCTRERAFLARCGACSAARVCGARQRACLIAAAWPHGIPPNRFVRESGRMRPIGLPPSMGLAVRGRSRLGRWWSQGESNPRPLECHSSALPTELWPRPSGSVRAARVLAPWPPVTRS